MLVTMYKERSHLAKLYRLTDRPGQVEPAAGQAQDLVWVEQLLKIHHYKNSCFYFEVIECARKATLVGLTTLAAQGTYEQARPSHSSRPFAVSPSMCVYGRSWSLAVLLLRQCWRSLPRFHLTSSGPMGC